MPFLEELLKEAEVVPAANQIVRSIPRAPRLFTQHANARSLQENHPYLPQSEISEFCKEKGILVEAYSPLGSTGSPLFKEEGVQELAKKHNVGAGTILISYQVSRGHVVLPKSVTPQRIEENLKTVQLSSEDVASLEEIHKKKGLTRFVYPEFGVNLGFPDKQ